MGPAELLFKWEVLKPLGFKQDETAFTYAVRCNPGFDPVKRKSRLTAKHVTLCGAFVKQDIAAYKPTLVIALGSEAAKAVTQSKEITLKKYIGQVLNGPGKTRLVLTYSPRTVIAKRDIGYLNSIKKAIQVFTNKLKPKPFPEMIKV